MENLTNKITDIKSAWVNPDKTLNLNLPCWQLAINTFLIQFLNHQKHWNNHSLLFAMGQALFEY